jgi:hypothetical protein
LCRLSDTAGQLERIRVERVDAIAVDLCRRVQSATCGLKKKIILENFEKQFKPVTTFRYHTASK